MAHDLKIKSLSPGGEVHHNKKIHELAELAVAKGPAKKSKSGAIVVTTGKYTGRSPKDRYIVDTPKIHKDINWGKVNLSLSPKSYQSLYKKVTAHLSASSNLYIQDGIACADNKYQLHVRLISEFAHQALFIQHLLRKPAGNELIGHEPDFTILAAPDCLADPIADGTNSEAFIVLNLEQKTCLIGGSLYAGEIKKSIFSYLNYILPKEGVLPMHCSANLGKNGDSALFFGLSGTGKTTLSADPDRLLIGDDEHGWSPSGIFNFEGGCYAKCINLKQENEPQIWSAVKEHTLLENVVMNEMGELNYADDSLAENTRAAYPLEYIKNSVAEGIGPHPETVIFLTADAFGVLPPVARLNENAAMYHFLSGYTSKLAGAERGIIEPQATFSECFGAPFMPLHPVTYAKLLKKYIKKHRSSVYLVNTGWIGGPYGVGKRISIKDTRAIIKAILEHRLDKIETKKDKYFNLAVPTSIPEVDDTILDPRALWQSGIFYDQKAQELATLFRNNMEKFGKIPEVIINEGPR